MPKKLFEILFRHRHYKINTCKVVSFLTKGKDWDKKETRNINLRLKYKEKIYINILDKTSIC